MEIRTRRLHIDSCLFCHKLFRSDGYVSEPLPTPTSGRCCLCGQNYAETQKLARKRLDFTVALKIARAMLESRDASKAYGALVDSLVSTLIPNLPNDIRDYQSRVERPEVRNVVIPRLQELLEQHKRSFGCQGTTNRRAAASEDAENVSEKKAEEPVDTMDTIFSHERMDRIKTNVDVEIWVASVVRLGVDDGLFEAELGKWTASEHLDKHRKHAREVHRKLTTP